MSHLTHLDEFFSPTPSSRTAPPRAKPGFGNYVATLRKPTAVTHSCVGRFTSPQASNLAICKGALISIYLNSDNGLEHLVDFPMYGRVVFMEFSRVYPFEKDTLFVATEVEKLCMFKWDAETSNVISIHTMLFRPILAERRIGDLRYNFTDYCQGGTISRGGETVVLYSKQKWLRVVHIDHLGRGNSALRKSFPSKKILDVKFLRNYLQPELALLYQGNDGNIHSGIYEILETDLAPKLVFQPDPTIEPTRLIPNPYSFLIIGKQGVLYIDKHERKRKFMGYFDIQAYGRVDENYKRCRYLLGGQDGHLLVMEIKKNDGDRLSGLTLRPLGKTSIASSITYLGDDVVYVGSRYSDSQLVKMHQLDEPGLNTNTPCLQVLKIFTNSGPIVDISLSNKPRGIRKLAMCCGTREDSSLEFVSTAVGINEKLFLNSQTIKRIWSLKFLTSDAYHTFLVVQSEANGISVLTANDTGAFENHTMEGLVSDSITVCCHEAGHRQFVQVTENSVRLIGSKTGALRDEWFSKSKIHFASATAKQVLLSTADKQLIYLDMMDWKLVEGKVEEGYDVSCMDISPVGTNPLYSKLAVVGTWAERCIVVLSLPELKVLTVEKVETCVPRCILLCSFEKIRYLLCALYDGTLLTFKLRDNGQLHEKETMTAGFANTMRTFRLNGVAHVYLSAEKVTSKLIFSKKKKLQQSIVNLTNVSDMCPFHRPDCSDGLAIAMENGLLICTIGDMVGETKIPMIDYGRRICQQEETGSYAVLVEETNRRHLVQLLDKEANKISSFRLHEQEIGLSIISCSFSGDQNTYYCVGTSGEVNAAQGRILVFIVRDGELNLVSEFPTNGAVHYLKALHGGLLVIVSMNTPRYLEWTMHGASHELHENPELAEIEFGGGGHGREERLALLSAGFQKYEMHDVDIDMEPKVRTTLTSMLLLHEDSCLYTDHLYNMFACDKFQDGGQPNQVGQWNTGELVTQMKAGTLSRLSDEDYAQAPASLFSTVSGALGVVVSLPPDVFEFLDKLQVSMRKRKRGKGCPDERSPPSCVGLLNVSPKKEFVDGDFIESFPSLSLRDQVRVTKELKVTVANIMTCIEYLGLYH